MPRRKSQDIPAFYALLRTLPRPKSNHLVYSEARLKRDHGLAAALARDKLHWPRGLGVRVYAVDHGRDAFVFDYRFRGRERQLTIGPIAAWEDVHLLSRHVRNLQHTVDTGGDPVGERNAVHVSPTLNQAAELYVLEYLPTLEWNTQTLYGDVLRRFVFSKKPVEPAKSRTTGIHAPPSVNLGTTKLIDIDQEKLQKLHDWVRDNCSAQYARTMMIGVFAGIYNLAIKKKMLPADFKPPCRGIKTVPPRVRKVTMTPAQMCRLYEALLAHSNRPAALILLLCLFTGARIGNCLAAQWDQFRFEEVDGVWRGLWMLSEEEVKQDHDYEPHLNSVLSKLLIDWKEDAEEVNAYRARHGLEPSPWLFPAQNAGGQRGPSKKRPRHRGRQGHQVDVQSFWKSIRTECGIPVQGPGSIRLHDLRRSFCTALASAGYSLDQAGTALGHVRVQTTKKHYGFIWDQVQHQMADDVLTVVSTGKALPTREKRETAELVQLRQEIAELRALLTKDKAAAD